MIVFYILLILAAVSLWLLLYFLYPSLGGFVKKLWKNSKDAMNKDDKRSN